MKSTLLSLLLFSFLLGSAQSNQSEYLEAKRQFSLANYREAMQSCQFITNDGVFGEYASFYYALSALKQKQLGLAEDMWKQIQVKYPDWDKQQEVSFWLTYTSFEQDKLLQAFREAESLPDEWKKFLVDSFLGKMSLEGLDSAYALNPNNKYVGEFYLKAIERQPYDERDQLMMIELSEKFGLETESVESLPLIKKDEYAVAVVLPFMFESIANPKTVIRNSIIFDLYQGMELAREELATKEKIKLNLFPFDTQKKSAVSYDLIKSKRLDNADVIIGPLYPGPSKVISQFSKEKKVTMINPLSSNDEVIDDNPYSYLFKPSYATQGREAARFAAQKFTDNKKLFIFYETNKDSIVANAYRKTIEKDSFLVVRFERLSNSDAQQIQKDFTEQFEVRLDIKFNQSEVDSIASLPDRIVRRRNLRNGATGKVIKDENGDNVIESYEVKFKVKPDSIGHVFAATSSNLLANNLISIVEVRNDSIGIIGYEDWLDFSLVSYDQLERLQINFLSPSYYDVESTNYNKLWEKFIEKIGREPSVYHLYGYELIWHIGKMMDEYGIYFQQGWSDGKLRSGFIMEGLKYGLYKDNQVVPVTTLKNLELQNQNIEK